MQHTKQYLALMAFFAVILAWAVGNVSFWDWITGGSIWGLFGAWLTGVLIPMLINGIWLDMKEPHP